jgi:hypothetical protein
MVPINSIRMMIARQRQPSSNTNLNPPMKNTTARKIKNRTMTILLAGESGTIDGGALAVIAATTG